MDITVHFITGWQFHPLLIDFVHVPGSHTGVNMEEVVKTSLDEMGILNKTVGFTIDNAGNNRTILKQLKE